MSARSQPVAADSPTPPPAAARSRSNQAADSPRNRRRAAASPSGDGTAGRRSLGRLAIDGTKQLVAVAIFVSLLAAASWGAYRAIVTTPRFAIRELDISGARVTTERKVTRVGGVQMGANIFSVDTSDVRRRLLSDPWIRDAHVARRLPNTLRIEIEEWTARAIASIDGQLFLVAETGEPFKRLDDGDPHDLPFVTGIDPDYLARDRSRELERIRTGMDVLRQYDRIRLSRVLPAEEVHLGADGAVVLTVGRQAVTFHLGRGRWRKKLLMAARVVSRVQRAGQQPGILFLDNEAHPERVVVRMR